jgi:hypothetical protein
LKSDPSGSIYAAYVLLRNGQNGFKSEALDAAVKLVSDPADLPMDRLHAAASLLRDYGSDRQFEVILTTLRRLKTTHEDQYRALFGAVEDRRNERILLAAAILIDDRRVGWGERFRYCDVAAGDIEAISGQHFGIQQEMTLEVRDRAVAAASEWLKRR